MGFFLELAENGFREWAGLLVPARAVAANIAARDDELERVISTYQLAAGPGSSRAFLSSSQRNLLDAEAARLRSEIASANTKADGASAVRAFDVETSLRSVASRASDRLGRVERARTIGSGGW